MTRYLWAGVAAVGLLCACGGNGPVKAAPEAAPAVSLPAGGGGGASFAAADRIEGWLTAAGVPFAPRPDLVMASFPEGCEWHAVYATDNPEVILEVYLFGDVFQAENFITNRHADYSVRDIAQQYGIVNNGAAVLVARFNETGDDDGKEDRLAAFISAFAAGR